MRLAVAGVLAGAALATAGVAGAEPVVPPGEPVPPGQPVVLGPGEMPVAAPAPPPVGAPPVPEISNPVYGQGQTPGAGGYIRDLWRAFNNGNPMDALMTGPAPGVATGAPPGAGPAPKLPPGYTSLTDPASSTPATERVPGVGGPPLPPGFVSLSDPAPPPEVLPIGAPGAAPADVAHPAAPPPPPVPAGPPLPPTIIANQ